MGVRKHVLVYRIRDDERKNDSFNARSGGAKRKDIMHGKKNQINTKN